MINFILKNFFQAVNKRITGSFFLDILLLLNDLVEID